MRFHGAYSFLSNFYAGPIELDGIEFPSVEHAYQAAKTMDLGERRLVRGARTPASAKKIGRTLKLRPDWNSVKLEIMRGLLRKKFTPGSVLAQKLCAIKEPIVEHNTWHDNIWGQCICPRCRNKRGRNLLGRLLMETRADLMRL